jgi:phospholipid transport system substrate-binding protein
MKRLPLTFAVLTVNLAALAGPAIAADAAAGEIARLDAALLAVTQAPKSVSVKGRYQTLAPTIERVFDLNAMTASAIGPGWSGFSSGQQRAAIAAFARLTTASFAANFGGFSGARFELAPDVQNRSGDKIVQTQLIRAGAAPVSLIYQLHRTPSGWKVIDIYFAGISQVATRRADFAASIAAGGAPALIAHLNALADKLMT